MTHQKVARVFLVSGIMIVMSAFASVMGTVEKYEAFVENNSHIIAAFNG